MRKGFYEHLIAFRRPLEIWEELVLCAGDATFGLSNTWCARLAVFASWVAPLALVEPLPHGFGRELPKLSIQPWPVTVGHAAGLPALAPTKDSRSAPNPAWGTELEPIARWSASSPWLLRLGRLYREACPFTTPTVQGGASQHHSAAAMSSGTEQRHWPPASSGFFPERRRGLEEEVRFAAPRHPMSHKLRPQYCVLLTNWTGQLELSYWPKNLQTMTGRTGEHRPPILVDQ